MTRLFTSLLLGLALAAAPGCGGDDDGGDGDGSDGVTIDASADTPDSGGGGDFDAAAAVLPTAAEFCTEYETVCGYGEDFTYGDETDCLDTYNGQDDEWKDCVNDHLGFADMSVDGSQDEEDHCSHAAGQAICT